MALFGALSNTKIFFYSIICVLSKHYFSEMCKLNQTNFIFLFETCALRIWAQMLSHIIQAHFRLKHQVIFAIKKKNCRKVHLNSRCNMVYKTKKYLKVIYLKR